MDHQILVLGLGNYLMGDEGLGVHFAQRMEQEDLPANIDVLDGGTGGFHLMSYLEHYSTIIAVDATLDDNPPGTIRLIRPRFSKDFPRALSTHDIGLKDLLEGLQILGKFPDIHLFVVSVENIQPLYIGLSDAVAAAIPALVEQTHTLIAILNQRIQATTETTS